MEPSKAKLMPTGEPTTIVGASLAERLGSAYAGMRLTLAVRPAPCEVCASTERREPHAVFEYTEGVAKLTGVQALCVACHRAHHVESTTETIHIATLSAVNKEPASLSALRLKLAKDLLTHRNGTWWVIEDRRAPEIYQPESEETPERPRRVQRIPQWTLDLSRGIAGRVADSLADTMAYARAMMSGSQGVDAP
jgi:hypothetical protein